MEFFVGIKVRARGLVWDVLSVDPAGEQQRLRLRCAEGDLVGLEWEVLHPHEPVEIQRAALRPDSPAPLAAWRLHHIAHLLDQAPGPGSMLAASPGRITVEPYQLVPLLRALEMPRPRLLLADGVGLGKTIQACLIATELIARRQAHRILVIAPSGPLLRQWEQELRLRFGLRFTVLADAAALRAQRRMLERGGNPFDAVALCLTSLDFAKQEPVLEELERSQWDLAVIDEAHHCVATAADGAPQTHRRRLAEVVARCADGLLLLTATPHDGIDAHFASLVALLDPSLTDGHGGLIGRHYRRHVVRRLKAHIRDPDSGEPLFRERAVVPVRIDASVPEAEPARAFHRALAAFVMPRLRRTGGGKPAADALAFISLLKRSVSTIRACAATLRVVADRYATADEDSASVRRERLRALRAWRQRVARYGVLDAVDEADAARLEAETMAADLRDHGGDATVQALGDLIRLAAAAEPADPKLDALVTEIRLIRTEHPDANILIYTEYADSQDAVLECLRDARGIAGTVLAISGATEERDRGLAAERFAAEDGMILVSTDSLAEGLNLHRRCRHLIHLDLPYNPNRLEQRNGRIDRYGQRHDPEIRYLFLGGTFEERLLLRLITKYEKARACITFMPDTLGVTADEDAWTTGLVAGFAEDPATLFPDAPPPIRTLDRAGQETDSDAYRALRREIDRAYDGFEPMAVRHGWMAGQGIGAEGTHLASACNARVAGNRMLGGIALDRFVADAIALETGQDPGPPGRLILPPAWRPGLDGLPGYDPHTGILTTSVDPDRMMDADGHALGFLGAAHPVVRLAAGAALRSDADATRDRRVAIGWGRPGDEAAVLFTLGIEIRSVRRLELRRMIAVLLPRSGSARAIDNPAEWLALARNESGPPPPLDAWERWFASWVPMREPLAMRAAQTVMRRMETAFTSRHDQAAERQREALDRWLTVRADDVCGAYRPPTSDLFGAPPPGPPWRLLPDPLDRLAGCAADPAIPTDRRRDAGAVVALQRASAQELTERGSLSAARLRTIGMLMLVPPDSTA